MHEPTYANIHDLVAVASRRPSTFLQVYDSDREEVTSTVSFAEFATLVARCQRVLVRLEVAKDARVAYYCQATEPRYFAYSVATMTFACCVNLNWRQPKEALISSLALTSPSHMIADAPYTDQARFLVSARRSGGPLTLCHLGTVPGKLASNEESLLALDQWADAAGRMAAQWPGGVPAGPRLDSEALIMFTSGSTSLPKPVPHRWRALEWGCASYALEHRPAGTGAGSRVVGTLCLLPNFHVIGFGLNFLLNLYHGDRAVIHPQSPTRALSAEVRYAPCLYTRAARSYARTTPCAPRT